MTPTAYVRVNRNGPTAHVICEPHDLHDLHPRTKPAQAAAAAHNTDHHRQETHQ